MNKITLQLDNKSKGFISYNKLIFLSNITKLDAYRISDRLDGLYIIFELKDDLIRLSIDMHYDIHLEDYLSNIIYHLINEPLGDGDDEHGQP